MCFFAAKEQHLLMVKQIFCAKKKNSTIFENKHKNCYTIQKYICIFLGVLFLLGKGRNSNAID